MAWWKLEKSAKLSYDGWVFGNTAWKAPPMASIVYPGTFDPITNGHIDLIHRAARLFDRVIIAVADSRKKQPLFDLAQRQRLCQLALADAGRVEIRTFGGLITDFVADCGAHAVLRGVRAIADFEYELQMANMNRALRPDFETVFLTPADHLSYISASLVREIASMGGDISAFVHPAVASALQDQFSQ
jgi:pantetheine-phosphate adenylyltransferase